MTAPQPEETILDAAVPAGLAEISAQLCQGLPTSSDLLEKYKQKLENICSCIVIDQDSCLLDLLMMLLEGLDELTEKNRDIAEAEQKLLQKVPVILSGFLSSGEGNQAEEQLLELLKDPQWIRPLSDAEVTELTAMFEPEHQSVQDDDSIEFDDLLEAISEQELPDTPASGNYKTTPQIDYTRPTQAHAQAMPVISDVNETRLESVEGIKAELSALTEKYHNLPTRLTAGDHQHLVNLLENMSDEVKDVSDAVNLVGLEGLYKCGKTLSQNINTLASSAVDLTAAQIELLMQCFRI